MIKWPSGPTTNAIYSKIRANKDLIQNGVVLAIDPSSGGSSPVGWAWAIKGKRESSGILEVSKKLPVARRLGELIQLFGEGFCDPKPDVLLIEKIRGSRAHAFLLWAVGATIAMFYDSVIIEIPTNIWKAYAGKGYEKSDEGDAICILESVLLLSQQSSSDVQQRNQ